MGPPPPLSPRPRAPPTADWLVESGGRMGGCPKLSMFLIRVGLGDANTSDWSHSHQGACFGV